MTREPWSRRRYLDTFATALVAGTAGCSTPPDLEELLETRTPAPAGPSGSEETVDQAGPTPEGASVYTRVYRSVIDSIALIRAFTPNGVGQGSGFCYGARNRLLTNQHVIEDAQTLELRFSRGEWRTGTVIGSDVYSDLAVVRVENPPQYVEPLPLVDRLPDIGQQVVALGSPFGLEKSLSVGVVSGVGRTLPTDGGFSIPDAIQTDAAVNPGNSGGPLVTLEGRVVGMVRSGGGENIGFAISATLIRRVVPALIARGEYDHPFMGITLTDVTPTVARANHLSEPQGVLVIDVLSDGPSAGVLRGSEGEQTINGVSVPTGGDVIVGLGDQPIRSVGELSRFLALETRPGQTIPVLVIRDRQRRQIDLRLGSRPPPSGAVGG